MEEWLSTCEGGGALRTGVLAVLRTPSAAAGSLAAKLGREVAPLSEALGSLGG